MGWAEGMVLNGKQIRHNTHLVEVFLVYKLCDVHLRVTVSDVHLTVNASLRYRL